MKNLLLDEEKDCIYQTQKAKFFVFGSEVAEVFDDMISRSVPYYLDLQILIGSIARKFYKENTAIYDLGCSTATSLVLIAKRLKEEEASIIGVDSSEPMLKKAQEKLERFKITDRVKLEKKNIEAVSFERSSLVLLNYTLQFIPESERAPLLLRIYDALVPGGALLITEKTAPDLTSQDRELVRELHEDFKAQNGYTESEIARKRESLKGSMIPIEERSNRKLLSQAGFTRVIEVMRGYSFITWLAVKN